jgi:hypothetical protein
VATDTGEAARTVTVVHHPNSYPAAKRNAVRITRIRPRTTAVHPTRTAAELSRQMSASAGLGIPGVARAHTDTVRTVPAMNTTETSEQSERIGRLGRILDTDVFSGFEDDTDDDLSFLAGGGRPDPPPFLEVGPVTRKVDEDGRLKLVFDAGSMCELLAWGAGSLEVTAGSGWVLLHQPPDLVGVKTDRYGQHAGITQDAKGLERLCLKPAQLAHLQLGPDRNVLVIPFVDSRYVALVNPSAVLFSLPSHITKILADASCLA